jgi:pimeloyl-ACP methyl ester carboxylesterase
MVFLGRLLPLLFAAPSPSSLSPAEQIVQDVEKLYADLDGANLSRKYSDTIKFSFVAPPSETHTNSWRCESQQEEARYDMTSDCVFEEISASHGSTKPIAIYLPGLDGVGISATQQFDDLAESFELWRMSISVDDRTSFTDLTAAVSKFVQDVAVGQNRSAILIGESFGGLLAPAVAMKARAAHHPSSGAVDPIKGMVLVNPATSFDKTQWDVFAPLLSTFKHLRDDNRDSPSIGPIKLPSAYSVVGSLALALTIPDSTQLRRIVDLITQSSITNSEELSATLESMVAGFGILDSSLPAEIIEFRVGRWLPVGTSIVNPRLSQLDVPTLIVAGQDDNMLPTKEEGKRLVDVLPDAVKLDVRGSGHFVLDERVNLTKAILDSTNIDPFNKKDEPKYDPITDWSLPPEEEVHDVIERQVKPLRNLVSPVFFSTGPDGKRIMGLGNLPSGEEDRPLLFVANHQFGGIDLGLIISQLIQERNIKARGLAHPVIFAAGGGQFAGGGPNRGQQPPGGGDPNKDGLFQKFGAVMVTPRNYYRLMQTKQAGLLFPGGVREVFHGKDEAYQLFWPETTDFVRTAARFNATIVPLSAVGAADSVNILIDAPDLVQLPFGLGERIANNSANTISARFDAENSEELFQPPFALPKPLPARHYFMFGKAFNTDDIDHTDKDACHKIYQDIQGEMRRGFDDVLRARKHDPYKDTARRIAYEQLTGKQAPTFPLSEVRR